MGQINFGNQKSTVHFFDALDSTIVDKIGFTLTNLGQNIRKVGIYEGVWLTKISDTSVEVGSGEIEILSENNQLDGTKRQIRVAFQNIETLTVSSATPYVILRYTFAASLTHYVDMFAVAVGSIQVNDLVVGRALYSGPTLTGFEYILRSEPLVFDKFLKIEPTVVASMKLIVRKGRFNYGLQNFDVFTQESPTFVAPGAQSRIDLLYLDTDGLVKISTGVQAASPVPPEYESKIVLAEVTLSAGQTQILAAHIKDVRSFLSSGSAFVTSGGGVAGQATRFKLSVDGVASNTALITAKMASLRNSDNAVITVSNVNLAVNIITSGLNGLDTGVPAANAKYFVWIVYNPVTTVLGGLVSASSTSPVLPSGFVFKELFSVLRTDSTSQFLGAKHHNGVYYWKDWPKLVESLSVQLSNWTAIDFSSYTFPEVAGSYFGSACTSNLQRVLITNDNTVPIAGSGNFSAPLNVVGNQFGHEEPGHSNTHQGYWELELIVPNTLYWITGPGVRETVFLHGFRIAR